MLYEGAVVNVLWGRAGGPAMATGRLKYDLDDVNYNGPSDTLAVEIGKTL
jgi:hypothetical protein